MKNGDLKRDIGLLSATILVIANMVGTGVFTTSGFIITELNSYSLLMLCWFLGGLFALMGAFSYAELGAMFPKAGGEYAYLKESFGKLPAFVSGWISLVVGFSAPIAAASIAFATYLLGNQERIWFSLELFDYEILTFNLISFVAISCVILFSYIHYHSVKLGSNVQNFLTIFKIVFILVLIIGGFTVGNGDISRVTITLLGDNFSISWTHFAISFIFISFAYSGWNAASYLGAEIKNPQKNLPLALLIGTIFVTILYMLLNFVYIYALSIDEMSGVLQVATKASNVLFGDKIGSIISLAISFGLLSVVSAMIMAGPRVYYAMAEDGLFFQRFKKICTKRNTPVQAIILQAIIAIVMILTSTFESLLIYIGFTLSLASMLTVVGLIELRVQKPQIPRPYKTLWYPYLPLIFILANIGIVVFSFLSRPFISSLGLLTILVGVIIYYKIK
ncbi:amino acid permease [Aliarcobacter butzleri]|uniref:Amino acid permease n=1 Tax=Aliarcobacter butzleri TaxID=28197 RepID=A0AAW7QA69_9BACT|nr:amino acid permease [Aliarcobacter butzleri]MDN5107809.1 amino acid permease [Aliarcobacter butzleri]MDN5122986.1 amino acid permease [Aliarcobacter butzleri]